MKKTFLLLWIFVFFLTPALVVMAQPGGNNSLPQGGNNSAPQAGNNCPPGKTCLTNPAKADSVAAFFEAVFNAIFILILPIAVLAMAVVGLMFVAARGNPEKLTRAKNAFLYTVLGTALVFGILVLLKMLTSLAKALGGPV